MASRAELVNRANALGLTASNYPNDSKLEQKVIYLETNSSTMAGTLATGTLTSDATQQANGDQVKIGDITYTFKTNLTGVKATGELTTDGTDFVDGETVTIDGKTYTFRDTLSSPAQQNEVLIGANAAASLDNLKLAINQGTTTWPTAANSSGEGSTWSTGTVRHHSVTAETNTNTVQTVQALRYGTYANGLPLLETCAHAAWGAATLGTVVGTEVAGVNDIPYEVLLGAAAADELDNLKSAINGTAGAGTTYSASTPPHPQVTAEANADTTQVIQAREMAVGEDIASTDPVDTGSHMAFGATTLASGVSDQNAVDATAKAQTSGGANV